MVVGIVQGVCCCFFVVVGFFGVSFVFFLCFLGEVVFVFCLFCFLSVSHLFLFFFLL